MWESVVRINMDALALAKLVSQNIESDVKVEEEAQGEPRYAYVKCKDAEGNLFIIQCVNLNTKDVLEIDYVDYIG
jgi:hypothetical protein